MKKKVWAYLVANLFVLNWSTVNHVFIAVWTFSFEDLKVHVGLGSISGVNDLLIQNILSAKAGKGNSVMMMLRNKSLIPFGLSEQLFL